MVNVIYICCYFSISRRYVGSEPLSPLTNRYNETLKEHLPSHGIEFVQIPRLVREETPISASAVRAALADGDKARVRNLVPKTTFDYLFKEESL